MVASPPHTIDFAESASLDIGVLVGLRYHETGVSETTPYGHFRADSPRCVASQPPVSPTSFEAAELTLLSRFAMIARP